MAEPRPARERDIEYDTGHVRSRSGDPVLNDSGPRAGTQRAPAEDIESVPGDDALGKSDVSPTRGRATVGIAVLGAIIVLTLLFVISLIGFGPHVPAEPPAMGLTDG